MCAGSGTVHDTTLLCLSAPRTLSSSLHRIHPQTIPISTITKHHKGYENMFFGGSKTRTLQLQDSFNLMRKWTWCTRNANRTPWTINSSSSTPLPTPSSSADILFMYFIASFTDASLICINIHSFYMNTTKQREVFNGADRSNGSMVGSHFNGSLINGLGK